MMTTFEAIKLLIEEDVRCDIHGDLYGHERVAEHLAERIDALFKENEELKDNGWTLSKGKSKRKIDAVIALAMATDRATRRVEVVEPGFFVV